MNLRQFVSYCIIALLFILDELIEIADLFVEFLEDAQAGAENFLTEELGWEVKKVDD